MSLIKEFRLYNSLTHDQKRVIEEKQIEGDHTPREWLALLGQLAEFDRYGDSSRKFISRFGCASIAILAITFFLGIVAGLFILFILALPIGVISLLLHLKWKRRDLPNQLRQFAVPLISILREEMEPNESLYLRMDLRSGTSKEKEVQDSSSSGKRRSGNVKETYYTNRWMEGEAVLADGSNLDWQIVDNIRQRRITKKSASGKTKIKTKFKVKTLMDVRLQLARKDYALMASAPGAKLGEKVEVKPGEKRNTVRIRRVIISSQVDAVPALKQFLDVIAGAYRRVTSSQGGEKQL